MKTAKNKSLVIAIFIIILIAYSLLMWILAPKYTAEFIITYAFGLISIIWLAYSVTFLNDRPKNFPQNFAFAGTAWVYFIFELIISMAVIGILYANLSSTIATIILIVIQIILFAIYAIRVLLLLLGKRHIENVGERAESKVLNIRQMVADIDVLIEQANDFGDDAVKVKKNLTEVRDAVRYSDPMSDDSLHDAEDEIKDSIILIERAVGENDAEGVDRFSIQILRQVKNRNNKVNMMK
jgi:hypothetical protein